MFKIYIALGGANLYGYVKNSPIDFFDIDGLRSAKSDDEVAEDTECSIQPCRDKCYEHLDFPDPSLGEYYFEECIRGCERTKMYFEEWFKDNADLSWTDGLLDCPCDIGNGKKSGDSSGVPGWEDLSGNLRGFHTGATLCMRSVPIKGKDKKKHSNQCCYDGCGKLITHGSGSGSADNISAVFPFYPHYDVDVRQAKWALLLDGGGWGCWSEKYLLRRPQKGSEKCPKNP
jgi:hypothetical protein